MPLSLLLSSSIPANVHPSVSTQEGKGRQGGNSDCPAVIVYVREREAHQQPLQSVGERRTTTTMMKKRRKKVAVCPQRHAMQ